MAANELTGKLTIDASGFLGGIQRALDSGTTAIKRWTDGAGRAKIAPEVDTGDAEKKLGGFGDKLKGLFGGDALKFAAGSLLSGGITAIASGISEAFTAVIDKGSEFEAGMAELSAITGVGGAALDNLGGKARQLAIEFGGSASDNVTAFKGILSKLGPDIANTPAALESMTRAVNTLSAATGDDAVASMDALTTGLLQFQVPLDDAGAAAAEMTKQMNVLAAGAKFGAAEVPEVSAAIKVAGVAASGAKVSFEETNAAIQALAAGGKVGAEAGTALRNVLGKLGEGRFLPKDVQDELKAANVDINKLGDTSIGFTDRLRELQKITKDAALTTKLFGTENAAAANILIRSVDAQDQLRTQITGTNTAFEQAATRQETFSAAFARFKALIADKAIAVFTALVPILTTGLNALGVVIEFVADNWKALIPGLSQAIDATSALIGWIDSLVDAEGHQIDSKREANNLELEGIEAKKKANETEQARQKTIQKLAGEYEKLGTNTKRTAAEEKRMQEISVQLNEQYPGLISSTKSFNENLANVKGAANDAQTALRSLTAEMAQLDKKQREIAFKNAQLDINQFGLDLNKAFDDLDIDAEPFRALFQRAIKEAHSGTQAGFDDALADLKIDLATPIAAALKDGKDVKAAREALAGYTGALQKFFDLRASATTKTPTVVTPEPTPTPPPGTDDEAEKKRKEAEEKARKEAEEREKKHQALLRLIAKQAETNRLADIEDAIQRELETFDSKRETELAKLQEEYGMFAEFETLKTQLATEGAKLREELEKKLRKDAAERTKKINEEATKREIDDLRRQQELITGESAQALEERFRLEREARARERTLIDAKDATALAVFDAATIRKNAEAEAAIELQVRREGIEKLATLAEQRRELALLDVDTRLAEELRRTDLTEQQKTELVRQAEQERRDIQAQFLNDTSLLHRSANLVRTALEEAFTVTVDTEAQKRRKETRQQATDDLQALREKQAAGLLSLEEFNKQSAGLQAKIRDNAESSLVGFSGFMTSLGTQFTGMLQRIATQFGGTFDDVLDKFSKGNAKLGDVLLSATGVFAGVLTQAAQNNENLLEASLKAAGKIAFDFLQKMVPIWLAQALGVELAKTGIVGAPLAIAGWLALTGVVEGILAGIRGSLGFNKGTDWVPGVYRGRDSVWAQMTPGEAVVQRDMNMKHGDLVRMIRRDDPRLNAIRKSLREPDGSRWSIDSEGRFHDRLNAVASLATATAAKLAAVDTQLEQTNGYLTHIMKSTDATADSNESIREMIKFQPPSRRRPT